MNANSINFRGRNLLFTADTDYGTEKLDPETFAWYGESYRFINSLKDQELFEWIDGLCAELANTGMFSNEVYSIHLNY